MTSIDGPSVWGRGAALLRPYLMRELHACATLRRRRHEAVQAQIVRFLAVVIGPVADGDQEGGGARQVHAEHRDGLAELRVVQLSERLLAELERLSETRDELLFGVGRVHGGALWHVDAGRLAAEDVVAFVCEVDLDLREAHLRRRGAVAVLVGRHRFGGGDQVAREPLLHLAERISNWGSGSRALSYGCGGRLRGDGSGGDSEDQQETGSGFH